MQYKTDFHYHKHIPFKPNKTPAMHLCTLSQNVNKLRNTKSSYMHIYISTYISSCLPAIEDDPLLLFPDLCCCAVSLSACRLVTRGVSTSSGLAGGVAVSSTRVYTRRNESCELRKAQVWSIWNIPGVTASGVGGVPVICKASFIGWSWKPPKLELSAWHSALIVDSASLAQCILVPYPFQPQNSNPRNEDEKFADLQSFNRFVFLPEIFKQRRKTHVHNSQP